MYHSQNNEAEVIARHFGGFVGSLLDIGANDGRTLSNSYDLIQNGWCAELVEPTDKGYGALVELYKGNPKVSYFNFGIGSKTGVCDFCNASDSLLATTIPGMLVKWETVTHEVIPVQFYSWQDALAQFPIKQFDFITIDAEGMDWEILQQMNLTELGCQCVCVEHNSDETIKAKIISYCSKYGLSNMLLCNGENVIMTL